MCNNPDDSIDFESALFFKYATVLPSSAPNNPIWHYTSLDGLKGIINKNSKIKLWFTHADYLNDTSEGKEIINFYKMACSQLQSSGEISREFFELINDVNPQSVEIFFNNNNGTNRVPCIARYTLFVCCFSLNGNSLDMWRYYSKGKSGYSLAFSSSLISGLINDPKYKGQNIRYFNVVYSNDEKTNKLMELIRDAYKVYNNYQNEQGKNKNDSIKNYIAYHLKEYKLMFKHECFHSEQEYRIVISISQDDESNQANIQYRQGSQGLIPYIEICMDNADMYLNGVCLSPFQDPLYDESTKSFLESNGFRCDVHHSQLPVRF